MTPALYATVNAKINCGDEIFKASGSTLLFEGYKIADKSTDENDTVETTLPELAEGDILNLLGLAGEQHFTQPQPRFTEASLIKTLEENGVGRPSTYAPTITILTSRNYVTKEKKLFYPTELGEIVNNIVANNFEDIASINFTASMEQKLDGIEEGKIVWQNIITEFYAPFAEKLCAAEKNLESVKLKDEETDVVCEFCGRNMVIKLGKFGKFLACPGFPECRNAKPILESAGVKCPKCGGEILVKKTKKGRVFFGCENTNDCGFMSWNKPTGSTCPKCGEHLILKNPKKIGCSNSKCDYTVRV
jgi:DNA topoisomerase-1